MSENRPHWTTTWGMFSMTALGILFIAANTWYTHRLVTDAMDNAQRQLRAYVFFESIAVTPVEDLPDELAVVVHYKNGGLTPAYKLTGWSRTIIGPYPPTGQFSPSQFARRASLLGPGATMHFSRPVRQESKEIRAGITSGNLAIYAFGEIQYRDAFEHWHTSGFRAFYLRKKPLSKNEEVEMGQLPEDNDAN